MDESMKEALAIYNQLQQSEIVLGYLIGLITWQMNNGNPSRIHTLEQLETELLNLRVRAEKALAGPDVEEMRRA